MPREIALHEPDYDKDTVSVAQTLVTNGPERSGVDGKHPKPSF